MLANPYTADALRARDKEMSVAYGPVFCRRPFPGEFTADYAQFLDSQHTSSSTFSKASGAGSLAKMNARHDLRQ